MTGGSLCIALIAIEKAQRDIGDERWVPTLEGQLLVTCESAISITDPVIEGPETVNSAMQMRRIG